MLQFYWELHCGGCHASFPKRLKAISTAVSLGKFIDQLLLKVISLQAKSTGHLIFWRNKESKFLLETLQSKKKKTRKDKHSQVLLVSRKNSWKWKACTSLIVGIFKRICCFDELFLRALTSTEQLFTDRPLYGRFLHNVHLFWLSIFGFRLSALQFSIVRSSHWRCSVRIVVLRNFAKFSGKHLWQSLFF